MKNLLMLAIVILGTTVMVNAQTEPKTAPAKEANHTKKKEKKADAKAAEVAHVKAEMKVKK